MNRRRIIRTAIASATVLALGAGGFVVGSGLAGSASTPAAASTQATEVMPVIAPIGQGPTAPAADTDGDPETFETSPAVGETVVVTPTEEPEPGPATIAAIAALDEADDPAATFDLRPYEAEGDPCATTGEADESCPDGLRSTVFSLTGAPFSLYTVINPPATAPGLYSVSCPAVELAADEVRIGIGTGSPSEVTVRYFPVGDPDSAREAGSVTTAEGRAEWAAAAPVPGTTGLPPLVVHCLTLNELLPEVRYEIVVTAESDSGEVRSETRYFGLDRDLTRPPARVIPIGNNILYVSAPHDPESTVAFRTALYNTDTVAPSCGDDHETFYPLAAVSDPGTGDVTRHYLESNGFLPEFTKRSGQAFYFPEGSNALVCMFVYRTDRPSWEWNTASYQYSMVAQSPDVTVPELTWSGVNMHPSARGGTVRVGFELRGGDSCGGRAFNVDTVEDRFVEVPEGFLLCNAGQTVGGASIVHGDMVVRTRVTGGSGGEPTTAAMLLPLSAERCFGTCELPPTTWYQVALPTVDVASGICGSGFGDCTPPTSATALGTAQVRVDWSHGFQNGQADWNIGELNESTPETPASDHPLMNTRNGLREVSDASGFHLEFDLETNRAAHYVAILSGDCILPDTVQEVAGDIGATPVVVRFDNVCHGSAYTVQVLLFADDAVSAFGPSQPDGLWMLGRTTTTPIEKRLNISYLVSDPDPGRTTTLLTPFAVTINGGSVDLQRFRGTCIYGDRENSAGIIADAELGELVTITVDLGMREAFGAADAGDRLVYPVCTDLAPGGRQLRFSVTVPLESITHEGLTISAPEGSPLGFSMTIRDWP